MRVELLFNELGINNSPLIISCEEQIKTKYRGFSGILPKSRKIPATQMRIALLLSLLFHFLSAVRPNQHHPIKDLPTRPQRYDKCNELIPNFQYRLHSYHFANNSLRTLLSQDPKDVRGPLSSRCSSYLIQEYKKRERFRQMKRCEFLPLPRLCPSSKKLSNEKLFLQQKDSKNKYGMHLVILFLLSHKPAAAMASVKEILESSFYFNGTIRFIFHLDSSSTDELWTEVSSFTAIYPQNTYLIPRHLAEDVEWGDISTAEAIHLSMSQARQRWNQQLSTFVVLSETSLVVAPLTSIYLFFHRYHGMSYPGAKPAVVPSTDPVWKLCLNDVSVVCDRRVFHLGWRDHPISNADGYFHGAHLFAFWSRPFIDWLLDTEEGENSYRALIQRLGQTATSDEFFWATLFYNSPFCQTLANIFDFKQGTGQELSAHVWSQDCDSSDNWGKEACQSMLHQPIGWWSGNSPEWITFGDIPQLIARQPLFVRKLKSDEKELEEMLSVIKSAHRQVYETVMSPQQQLEVIFSLFPSAQQTELSSSLSVLSSLHSTHSQPKRKYYKRYRNISPSETLLSSDPGVRDEVSNELAQEYEELTTPSRGEPRYYLTTFEKKKSRGKEQKRLCVRIKRSDGSLEWVKCVSRDGNNPKPTPFVLRNCIGNVTLLHNGAGTEEEEGSDTCTNTTTPSSSSLLMSSILPSGHLFGHCSLVSMDYTRTVSGIPFCLSPALVKFNTEYNKGPSAISYNDIHGQRISGTGIGFLPCDVDYSVGYAEQLFIFQKDGTVEYGTRFSRSKDFIRQKMASGDIEELTRGRVDRKEQIDPSLCVVKRGEDRIALAACSVAKKKEKVVLILASSLS
jgi:hypothetical protein